jgi:hypothetical protein
LQVVCTEVDNSGKGPWGSTGELHTVVYHPKGTEKLYNGNNNYNSSTNTNAAGTPNKLGKVTLCCAVAARGFSRFPTFTSIRKELGGFGDIHSF